MTSPSPTHAPPPPADRDAHSDAPTATTTGPSGTQTIAPPAPAPAPASKPADRPRRPEQRPTPAPSTRPARHRPPKLALLLLAMLILGPVGWWLSPLIPWTPPWLHPAGPLVASGTLEADEVLVGSEAAGRIVALAQEGQPIAAGQVVAQLDDSLLRIQFRQADAATQQQLAIQSDKYQLRSPISGVVTRVPMHTGEVAAAGQTVVAVADLNALEMTAYILERDLGRVRVGQEVAVVADPFPGRAFYGVVTSTNQRAEFTPRNVQTQRDRLNLVFGVKIRVDNPDGALKPGMPADATFPPLS
jgi:multidrug resistance efflux pump